MMQISLYKNDKPWTDAVGAPPDSTPIQPISFGIASSGSSVGHVDREKKIHHRPTLELPKTYLLELLEVHQQIEGAVSKEILILKVQSKKDLEEIERLEKEKEASLQRHAEEAAARHSWSVLGVVAQYLTTGTSIVVGAALGPATWAGGLLLASGILGLANRVMEDTRGWKAVMAWFTKSVELQKTYARKIETFSLYFELGVGLAGGAHGCWTGVSAIASIGRGTLANTAASSIRIASSGMQATSRLGKSFLDKRMSDLQARLKVLDAKTERIRMETSQQMQDSKNLTDTAQVIGDEIREVVSSSEFQDLYL